jgi:PKD repeat protein
LHVGLPGSEGTAAGSRGNSPLFAGPLGNADIAACNPVPPAAQSSCNLTYHSGSVMRTNTTHLVFWAPTGYSFPAGYKELLGRYLTDVAHDSGDATFTDSVGTQYYDTVGGGQHNVQNTSTYAGALTDTTAYPTATTGCAAQQGTATACLTQTQEFTELDSFINSQSGTRGLGDLWFIVLPPNVQTCYDDSSWCGPYGAGTSGNEYCAYHNSFTGGFSGTTPTIFANMVYAPGDGCSNQQPNNNSADITVDVLSHEMNEAITNPNGGGWFSDTTTNGGEIGDQCNFIYGASIGHTPTGTYNELINGNPYSAQQEWSNATSSCVTNFGAVAPTAAFTDSPSSPKALDTVSFDGTSSHSNDTGGSIVSYSWDFGDGATGSGATPTHSYAQAGPYTVKLTVEDSAGMTDSTTHGVDVVARATTLTYTGATSGDYNDPVTLSGTLTDTVSTNGIANEQVMFTLGTESCSAMTLSSGDASCSVTPTDDPGSYTAGASFGGDPTYAANGGSSPFTLSQEETALTYTGATTSHYHDPVTVAAQLTDPVGGAAISGKTVTFTIGTSASDTCSAMTGTSGTASCSITPTQTGTQTIAVSFAGDTDYVAGGTSQSFSLTPEETTMAYTGPTTILASASGATLTATLVEDGSGDNDSDGGSPAPVPAQSVTLSLGTQTCTGTTNPSGNVTCTIPSVTVPLGPEIVGAAFTGNAFYSASSATTTAIVFAFPSRGAFTLGDRTVAAATPGTTTVTWWGDTWSTLNRLSGGTAPPSDKGFADSVSLPTTTPPAACGGNWATTGGNSPPPTSGVPSYMGTLVTSKVKKAGQGIAGDTVSIVVVKVNPGYGPSPMNHGTGVIVATYC